MRLILFLLAGVAGAAVHPTVFTTPADVARGRELSARVPWAKKAAAKVMADAAKWLARDDDWYRKNTPASGAAFAYGFTGYPNCRGSWGTWGCVHASFENPGHVTCANGHVLPDAAHPDAGTGYVGPDKRLHYFIGSYNAWVVETFTFKALDSLVAAYSLTGDENSCYYPVFMRQSQRKLTADVAEAAPARQAPRRDACDSANLR